MEYQLLGSLLDGIVQLTKIKIRNNLKELMYAQIIREKLMHIQHLQLFLI